MMVILMMSILILLITWWKNEIFTINVRSARAGVYDRTVHQLAKQAVIALRKC